MMEGLLPALEAVGAPPRLRMFAQEMGSAGTADLVEYSVTTGESPAPWRLTYYYGTAGDSASLDNVHRAFERVGSAVDCDTSCFQHGFPTSRLRQQDVGQIVVSYDARHNEAESRLKYYVIFEGEPDPASLDEMLSAFGVRLPPGTQAGTVHSVGFDLNVSGLLDIKIYISLDPTRSRRILASPRPWLRVLHFSRAVLVHYSMLAGRGRKVHLAVHRTQELQRCLEEVLGDLPNTAALRAHLAAIADNGGPALEPWVLTFPYDDGAFDVGNYTVYFHEKRDR